MKKNKKKLKKQAQQNTTTEPPMSKEAKAKLEEPKKKKQGFFARWKKAAHERSLIDHPVRDRILFYTGRFFKAVVWFIILNIPTMYYFNLIQMTVEATALTSKALWFTQEQLQWLGIFSAILSVFSLHKIKHLGWSFKRDSRKAKQKDHE